MTHPMPEISVLLKRLRLHHLNDFIANAIEKRLKDN